jgi:hypothetical protein
MRYYILNFNLKKKDFLGKELLKADNNDTDVYERKKEYF